jgi:hypothetical protein
MDFNNNSWHGVDTFKLVLVAVLLLSLSSITKARNYPAVQTGYLCTSSYGGYWSTPAPTSYDECANTLAAHFTSLNTGYTFKWMGQGDWYDTWRTDNGVYNRSYQLPTGFSVVYTCPSGGTLFGSTCINAPDCPADQPQQPDGTCTPPPPKCETGKAVTGKMYLRVNPITHKLPGGLICKEGCLADAEGASPTRIDDKGNIYGTFQFFQLNEKCTDGDTVPVEYPSMGSGSDTGEDIPTGFPGTGDGTNPGGGGDGTNPGGGGDGTNPGGGDGTNPGGGGDGTNPGSGDEDKEESRRHALGSCERFECGGDAIDCEVLRGIWKLQCQTEWMTQPNPFSVEADNMASQPDMPLVGQFEVDKYFSEKTFVSTHAACPPDLQMTVFSRSLTVPLGWLCQYLSVIKAVLNILAWLYVIKLFISEL